MIIDFHCHAGKGDKMTEPWNTDAPLGKYLRRARAAGIEKTVVLAPIHGDYAKANAQIARIVKQHRDRLIGFAFVHPIRDAGNIFLMVRHAVVNWHFRGIKVHGIDAMPTREVCETARAFQIPILIDVISKAEVIDMIAPQYRDVNFVIPHLGSFTDNWRAHEHVCCQLAKHPNVYADTSGVRQFDYIVEAVKRGGARKVLFGSDGPWIHPGLELYKIKLLGLPREEEDLILGGNALRLLRQARVGRRAEHIHTRRSPRRARHTRKQSETEMQQVESLKDPLAEWEFIP